MSQVAAQSRFTAALTELMSRIPSSGELPSHCPHQRAKEIRNRAAAQAGLTSGALALPPGPLGLVTALPDLMNTYRIQQQMVADIAGCYGKTAELRRESMIYCLFKQGAAALVRDLVVRAGEKIVVRKASVKMIQQLLEKLGIQVSQRFLAKAATRWLPLVGAVALGAYSAKDTHEVGDNAIEIFSAQVVTVNP